MEGMEDPEYYSSDFFVRTLGSEDIDVKHFMYLVGRVSIYCDGTDNITGESCIPSNPQLSSSASFLRLNVLSSLN